MPEFHINTLYHSVDLTANHTDFAVKKQPSWWKLKVSSVIRCVHTVKPGQNPLTAAVVPSSTSIDTSI